MLKLGVKISEEGIYFIWMANIKHKVSTCDNG